MDTEETMLGCSEASVGKAQRRGQLHSPEQAHLCSPEWHLWPWALLPGMLVPALMQQAPMRGAQRLLPPEAPGTNAGEECSASETHACLCQCR